MYLSHYKEQGNFAHLAVQFFMGTRENTALSIKEGRPIFDDVEMVKFQVQGDKFTELVALASDQSSELDPVNGRRLTYAQLHHGPYEAFKQGIEYKGSGTPLSELPFLSAAKRAELAALKVTTAEGLAGLEGTNLQRLGMGGRELKNQATAWLEQAAGAAPIMRLTAENEALKLRLDQMAERLASLTSSLPAAPSVPSSKVIQDASVAPAVESPFSGWGDEDIVNWIVNNGGTRPHPNCSRDTLVRKADEWNAELKSRNAGG